MSQEFERFAAQYGTYNTIQRQVAAQLLEPISSLQASNILDIGCGNGTLFNAITWPINRFDALDNAPSMLAIHPQANHVTCHHVDFNTPHWHQPFCHQGYELILSSSALQWSNNLSRNFAQIAQINAPFALALFSAKTFSSLFEHFGLPPVLPSTAAIETAASKHFSYTTKRKQYQLRFKSSAQMLHYLKHSGVSSGHRGVSIHTLRELIAQNRFKQLEFEVIFLYSTSLKVQ